MKKKYLLLEFLAVFFLLALPPVFAKRTGAVDYTISFSTALELLIALTLQFQYVYAHKPDEKQRKASLIRILMWTPITLGLLMLIFSLTELLSILASSQTSLPARAPLQAFPAPQSLLQGGVSQAQSSPLIENPAPFYWVNLIISLAISAFYEEVLYRQFLPETLHALLGKWRPAVEIFCITLFALAHIYLGLFSVLNALLCGIALRVCRVKTRGITASFAAHFIYNFLLILFSSLITLPVLPPT